MVIHIPTYIKLGYKYKFMIDFKHKAIRKMMKLIVPVLIGSSITQVNFLVDRAFASSLGEGGISTLNFANKLNLFVYGVFGTAISTVVYTELSRKSAKEDIKEYERIITRSINTINLIMIPATVGMIVLRAPLIDIVFKHGAFDNNAAKLTATALVCYAPAMIVYGIRDVMNRAFYSIKDTRTPMINSAMGVVVNIIFNVILVRYMGIKGLALATTTAAIVTSILLLVSFKKKTRFNYRYITITFIKIVIASLIMGVIILAINRGLNKILGVGVMYNLINLAFSTLAGIIIYSIGIATFNVEEYNCLMRKIILKINKFDKTPNKIPRTKIK